jgi:glucose/arabinose dehydrogenase
MASGPFLYAENVVKNTLVCVVLVGGLTACGGTVSINTGGGGPVPTPILPPLPTPSVPIRVETFVAGASFPVSLAFAADGRLFYTELQTGNIRVVQANGQLQAQPFATVPVATAGEQGLLGLALDPGFATNRFVYVYHTHPSPRRHRIVRFTDSAGSGTNETVIVDNLPVNPNASFPNHNGGRLAFGPDGRLFVTIGDVGDPANAQSSTTVAGKLLSYDAAGPLPVARVIAQGLRNPFGLTFHRVTGTAYVTDNGPTCDDEVNRITQGGNYGWRPGYPCADTDPQYMQPLLRFTPPIAPTGMVFYAGSVFPEWRNHLLFTSYNDGALRRVVPDDLQQGLILEQQTVVNGGFGALLDVTVGPDGNLYVAAQSAILRIVRGP